MAIIGDALRQAFMPKREYESLRDEDRAWLRLQRPLSMAGLAFISLAIVISTWISLSIVFPSDGLKRPFCVDLRLQPLSINASDGDGGGESEDLFSSAFYLTDQETVDYYWMVLFVPSTLLFFASAVYLLAGITVAYTAPTRHWCLKVVENNYCASKRGGVRCLSVLNAAFAIIFGLLAIILGSSLVTLGSSCSLALFWCYEIASWGLVILYGGTAFFLRSKAALILGEGNFSGRNLGLEMLEAYPAEVTPEVERHVNEGFKTWMGSSLLSSDEEDEPDDYQEVLHPVLSDTVGKNCSSLLSRRVFLIRTVYASSIVTDIKAAVPILFEHTNWFANASKDCNLPNFRLSLVFEVQSWNIEGVNFMTELMLLTQLECGVKRGGCCISSRYCS
ncbi:unnamed protein product [Camellia sinensis]